MVVNNMNINEKVGARCSPPNRNHQVFNKTNIVKRRHTFVSYLRLALRHCINMDIPSIMYKIGHTMPNTQPGGWYWLAFFLALRFFRKLDNIPNTTGKSKYMMSDVCTAVILHVGNIN